MLESGGYDLGEFTPEQKTYIMALVKLSYNDSYDNAKEEVTIKVMKALKES